MINVILIGFMGCGKSTFGKWLADKQQMNFVDTDEMIEEIAGTTISNLFEEKGEAYFRQFETEMLRLMLGNTRDLTLEEFRNADLARYIIDRSAIVSVGGGLPMKEENRTLLKKMGKVVFLDAGVDELVKRLEGDNTRPLLKGTNLRERIENLMDIRLSTYEDLADVIIDTDARTMYEIYEELMKEWE
ncbi:MAG: shikimate kinase [Lachnospiraceae bacterium]